MKLEKVGKYVVESFYEPYKYDVLVDESGKPVYLIDNGEVYPVREDDVVFDSLKEAEEYHKKLIGNIDKNRIGEYIDFLLKEDLLLEEMGDAYFVNKLYENEEKRPSVSMASRERLLLSKALSGILNIDGCAFRKEEVSIVKYYNDYILLELKNGVEVKTRDEFDIFIVTSIFGNNESVYKFSNK